jgi:hypothetical protein
LKTVDFLLQSGIRFDCNEQGRFSISGHQLMDSLKMCRELIHMQNRFPLFLSEAEVDAEKSCSSAVKCR